MPEIVDQLEREAAIQPQASVLVQAPAGSGKTNLLTRRFLRLLAEVDEPGEILAITFTKAAAAEMRDRILSEIEKASTLSTAPIGNDSDMPVLGWRAWCHSQRMEWNLLEASGSLRILTIDAFCRQLAMRQPMVSRLGGSADITADPREFYLRAARGALREIDRAESQVGDAIAALLEWRDNNWQEIEELLVKMLAGREQWMQAFVLDSEPDWSLLRTRLEAPFQRAAKAALIALGNAFKQAPVAEETLLWLARFAVANDNESVRELAQATSLPDGSEDDIGDGLDLYRCAANFLLTASDATWRKKGGLDKRNGFPATDAGRAAKNRFAELIVTLSAISGLEEQLAGVRKLPPAQYQDAEWEIVKASFILLRRAAAELKVVFAETGAVDYTEIAQEARGVLCDQQGEVTDTAIAEGAKVRHLLVDEFQDTSRRQYELIANLMRAWPEREGRSCFAVGDPQQSIYAFRQAEAELFGRVRDRGFEMPGEETLPMEKRQLRANFRTAHELINELNERFAKVFAEDRQIEFASADAAREGTSLTSGKHFALHLDFVADSSKKDSGDAGRQCVESLKAKSLQAQIQRTLQLIANYAPQLQAAENSQGQKKFRIAILGRKRAVLEPIARAMRDAGIRYRAVDLESLGGRPEVLDALAMAKAVTSPQDRIAWLGLLRAPWAGLQLADLNAICGGRGFSEYAIPELLDLHFQQLSNAGKLVVTRIKTALQQSAAWREEHPEATLGTWMEEIWLQLGADQTVTREQLANIDLLWETFDKLPNGELDLNGAGIDNALVEMKARPDPEASPDVGVQLMSIHKSKGLEFEVVIVPELQSLSGGTRHSMLTWMERAFDEDEERNAELTEFLIAPLDAKGAEKGGTKVWVTRALNRRELDEVRRVFYVAATRAREDLHLFARPGFSIASGEPRLSKPKTGSLLEAAWPALEDEIRASFAAWCEQNPTLIAELVATPNASDELPAITAAAEEIPTEELPKPAWNKLRRLPVDALIDRPVQTRRREAEVEMITGNEPLYKRHEGGLRSRVLGRAVHLLLEDLAEWHKRVDWDEAILRTENSSDKIIAEARSAGMSLSDAEAITAEADEILASAVHDDWCQWILQPHHEAESEAGWSGVVGGTLRTLRPDRVFRADFPAPAESDDPSAEQQPWWIIDYKTTLGVEDGEAIDIAELRSRYAEQLERYGDFLRRMKNDGVPIRAGIYYPRLGLFDHWELAQ